MQSKRFDFSDGFAYAVDTEEMRVQTRAENLYNLNYNSSKIILHREDGPALKFTSKYLGYNNKPEEVTTIEWYRNGCIFNSRADYLEAMPRTNKFWEKEFKKMDKISHERRILDFTEEEISVGNVVGIAG